MGSQALGLFVINKVNSHPLPKDGTYTEKAFKIALRCITDRLGCKEEDLCTSNLSNFYSFYKGAIPEEPAAQIFSCYEEGKKRGELEAILGLGICYEEGFGVKKDLDEAFKWFSTAAEQENLEGRRQEALAILDGNGTEENKKLGFILIKTLTSEYPFAVNSLGYCYLNGEGTAKDLVKAVECFEKAAALNHPNALFNLGYCYFNGKGTAKDERRAFEWYEKAVALNHPEALNNLGMCYKNGEGTAKDPVKAVACFKKAAALNNPTALNNLGICYFKGEGTAEDFVKAFECFEKGAALNNPNALNNLGKCYLNGKGTAKDFVKGFECFKKATNLNNPEGLVNLGVCYFNGEGTAKDPVKAVECFKKGAALNDPEALLNLGACYENGEEKAKDPVKAFECYEKGAALNHPIALFNLGVRYFNGRGTAKDPVKGFECFEKAVALNYPEALYNLGVCYFQGLGTDQDFVKGFECFEKGVALNYPEALYNLGVCYCKGEGTAKEFVKAVECFKKATVLNHPKAFYNLGVCYKNGEGVKKDKLEALKWYKLALKKGIASAQTALNLLVQVREEGDNHLFPLTFISPEFEKGWDFQEKAEKAEDDQTKEIALEEAKNAYIEALKNFPHKGDIKIFSGINPEIDFEEEEYLDPTTFDSLKEEEVILRLPDGSLIQESTLISWESDSQNKGKNPVLPDMTLYSYKEGTIVYEISREDFQKMRKILKFIVSSGVLEHIKG